MKASLHPVETRSARQWRRGVSGDTAIERPLADEAPVGLLYDGCPHVVLMATPSDVEDLAVGFTLSERIAGRADITDVTIESLDEGLRVDIRLTAEGRKGRASARSRSMEGRSSCGLCGVTRLAQAVRPLSPLGDGEVISRNAIEAAIDALETRQTLGRLTGAMHAAAFADDGEDRSVRGFTVVARDLPRGCLAAYYPEANPLLALSERDLKSGTPAYKAMPVRLAVAR